jgi:diguanylate cyclase (GGDEF)-like protein
VSDRSVGATKPKRIDPVFMEDERVKQSLVAFGLIAIALLLVISVVNLATESGKLVWFTLVMSAIIAGCLINVRVSGRTTLTKHLYGLLMTIMAFELILSGGVQGNGHLWIFILPPVCYLLMGMLWGSVYFALILCVTALVLFSSWFTGSAYPYNTAFGIRFEMAMIGVAGMSLWYELIRRRMHRELAESYQRIKDVSRHDELTGLFNRRGGMELIEHYKHVCERQASHCSVMMIDIDYFKRVNDTYGHAVGDEVLRGVCQTLGETVRSQDIGIRWGGEEFIYLLPGTDIDGARRIAQKALAQVRNQPIKSAVGEIRVTCSIGIAQRAAGESSMRFIERADALLYEAKQSGRDRVAG